MTVALHLLAATTGLLLGSFANVAIVRLPADASVVWPRSHCPRCRRTLAAHELVPVLSWLWLRARCASCAAPISVRYPLVEALCGLLAWLLWRRFVPGGLPDVGEAVAWFAFLVFTVALVVGALVDARHHLLPDETTVAMIPMGVAAAVLLDAVGYAGWGAVGWRQAVLGAAAGAAAFGLLGLGARWASGRDALGAGDVKLVAAIGAWLGVFPGLLVAVQIGALLGSAWGIGQWMALGRRTVMPFGPALAGGALVWLLYGDVLVRWLLPGWGRWLG